MRKRVFGRHLSRGRKARGALFRSQIRALINSGKIETTRAKAKSIQGQMEKLVSLAKKNNISARRNVSGQLGNDRETVERLFLKVVPAFKERNSGFTRIIPLPRRGGDAAEMARIEWTEKISLSEESKSKKAAAKDATKEKTRKKKS